MLVNKNSDNVLKDPFPSRVETCCLYSTMNFHNYKVSNRVSTKTYIICPRKQPTSFHSVEVNPFSEKKKKNHKKASLFCLAYKELLTY